MAKGQEGGRTAVTRRQFLVFSAVGVASSYFSLLGARPLSGFIGETSLFPPESKRPLRDKRRFSSSSVDQIIDDVQRSNTDRELVALFENCFPNALDTTVDKCYKKDGKPYTYLVTGDIGVMWLRDSSFQVMPYVELSNNDRPLRDLITGVINQQTEFILRDPYANAFYHDDTEVSPHLSDKTEMRPGVFERKWEPDSLAAAVHLAYKYWNATGDGAFMDGQWVAAVHQIVDTFEQQQRIQDKGPYSFSRAGLTNTENVPNDGWGRDTKKIGLIHSTHRPSDDACEYPFHIPANLFAATALNELSEMFTINSIDVRFARRCSRMSDTIKQAVNDCGIVDHPRWGRIYAYEIDGLGGKAIMDDANVPGLLSLPYLDYQYFDDPVYQNTRRFALSRDNPYFHQGKYAQGVGSPHTEFTIPNGVWPLSLVAEALTGEYAYAATTGQRPGDAAVAQVKASLKSLRDTHAGTFSMHESIDPDRPPHYTRPWFAMANSFFGELFLNVYNNHPELLGNL
jgi:uncharacterized protein